MRILPCLSLFLASAATASAAVTWPSSNQTTVAFSTVGNLQLKTDIYLPSNLKAGQTVGAIIQYHGGGLVSGGRKDVWFPTWLKDFANTNSLILLSPDYRLLYPDAGAQIFVDVASLWSFLQNPSFSKNYLPSNIKLDGTKIAVAGFSGGGYPARAAGFLAPKPKAIMSVYGMGGDWLLDHWLQPNQPHPTINFIFPEDPVKIAALLATKPASIGDSPVSVVPPGQFVDDLGRMGLFTAWVNNGTILDTLTTKTGLSATLRALPYGSRYAAIPTQYKPLFLEYLYTKSFPPTVLVHGTADDVVLPAESEKTYNQLKALGVTTQYLTLAGAGHGLVDATGQPYPGSDAILLQGANFLLQQLRK
ncbi:hypothetical protein HDV00_008122 [Rhizophlyctis rosea]|nr:hypothetical protein HDV00_008122 [Rhizophlyctis rosea]